MFSPDLLLNALAKMAGVTKEQIVGAINQGLSAIEFIRNKAAETEERLAKLETQNAEMLEILKNGTRTENQPVKRNVRRALPSPGTGNGIEGSNSAEH